MRDKPVTLILLAALVVRAMLLAAAWHRPEALFTRDSREYMELSDNWAETGHFARDARPEIFRTPGYPLLLMASIPAGQHWWRLAAAVQILMDVATVYLAFALGVMLVSRRAGLWAAGLLAVTPVMAAGSVRILSDTPFTLLVTLAAALLVHHLRTSRWWSLAAAAAALGAGCYFRPVGLALAAVCAVALLLRRPRLKRAGIFAAVVAACVGPWVIRNAATADYYGFSSFGTDAMYYFAAPEVLAETEPIGRAEARRRMQEEFEDFRSEHPGLTVGAYARYRAGRALAIISAHPATYARLHLLGSLGIFLPAATDVLETLGVTAGRQGTVDVLHRDGPAAAAQHYFGGRTWAMALAVPMVLLAAAKCLAAAVCVVCGLRRRVGLEAGLLAAMVVVTVLLPGPFGLPRYRMPIEPIVCLAAACGLCGLMRRRRTGAAAGLSDAAAPR